MAKSESEAKVTVNIDEKSIDAKLAEAIFSSKLGAAVTARVEAELKTWADQSSGYSVMQNAIRVYLKDQVVAIIAEEYGEKITGLVHEGLNMVIAEGLHSPVIQDCVASMFRDTHAVRAQLKILLGQSE